MFYQLFSSSYLPLVIMLFGAVAVRRYGLNVLVVVLIYCMIKYNLLVSSKIKSVTSSVSISLSNKMFLAQNSAFYLLEFI
jgi:hypothetical protein